MDGDSTPLSPARAVVSPGGMQRLPQSGAVAARLRSLIHEHVRPSTGPPGKGGCRQGSVVQPSRMCLAPVHARRRRPRSGLSVLGMRVRLAEAAIWSATCGTVR